MLGDRSVEVCARVKDTREFVCGSPNGNAKVILPSGENSFAEMRDVLVVQHGLPGVLWRKNMEDKCGRYIGQNRSSCAVFPVPAGIKQIDVVLNLADDSDTDRCRRVLTDQPFALEKYVANLFALIKDVRGEINRMCRLHLAGHSYGSASLLWALLQMKKEGMPCPASCSFLAPFVKIELGGQNPGIALSIVNSRLRAWCSLNHNNQVDCLRKEVVQGCGRWYEFKEESILDSHRRLFNQAFFAALASLRGVAGITDIKVFSGAQDEYIGREHVDLLMSYFGEATSACVLDNDDHNVNSVQPEDLFRRE